MNQTTGSPDARRVALLLEYDGARFAGSQLQTNARTVQAVLEAAIEKTTGEAARVAFAGRTDAGVHARGQVAAFDTSTRLDVSTLRRAINSRLPADVAVRAAANVEAGFDPRRWAVRRHYRYIIDNTATRPVLDRERVWHVPHHLDEAAMSAAACSVLGVHDFAAFASRLEDPAASTVRDLQRFEVQRLGSRLTCDLVANAFLPHQVRRMVGSLVSVGRAKMTPDEYTALLLGVAASAGPAAPPHGLYLEHVEYRDDPFQNEGLDSEHRLC